MSGSIYLRQNEQRTDEGEQLLYWQLLRNIAITGEFTFLAVIAQVSAADGRTVYPTFCNILGTILVLFFVCTCKVHRRDHKWQCTCPLMMVHILVLLFIFIDILMICLSHTGQVVDNVIASVVWRLVWLLYSAFCLLLTYDQHDSQPPFPSACIKGFYERRADKKSAIEAARHHQRIEISDVCYTTASSNCTVVGPQQSSSLVSSLTTSAYMEEAPPLTHHVQ